jgi:hypothetical protein
VYVDDIVLGCSYHSWVARFAEDVRNEFEMSMMGELQFYLGLQIKQAKEGTFVDQAKYMKDILKKFMMDASKRLSTSMSMTTVLDTAEDGEPMNQKEYRSIIGSLLYLRATRPLFTAKFGTRPIGLTPPVRPESLNGLIGGASCSRSGNGHTGLTGGPDRSDRSTPSLSRIVESL